MRFSTSVEYAVHGLVYLSLAGAGRAVQLADIASAIRVPESYLRKVFQLLSRRGVVFSQRGARGGYALAREPGSITLREVVDALEGPLPSYACLKAARSCGIEGRCPVRSAFDGARDRMAWELERVSLGALLEEMPASSREAGWLAAAGRPGTRPSPRVAG